MGKQVVAIVLSILLLGGAGAGVYIWRTSVNNDSNNPTETVVSRVETVESVETNITFDESVSEEINSQSNSTEDTENSDISSSNYISNNYSVIKTIDTTNGEEILPREVLGDEFASSYLSFEADGTFRLNLGYMAKSGTYSIDYSKHCINIKYDDEETESFDFTIDDMGEIGLVIVPYGDYDIYFG